MGPLSVGMDVYWQKLFLYAFEALDGKAVMPRREAYSSKQGARAADADEIQDDAAPSKKTALVKFIYPFFLSFCEDFSRLPRLCHE